MAYNKNKLHKNLGNWSRDMLNFGFLEKGLGQVSPPHFLYDFSRKMFLMLYSIKWLNFIVQLSLLLEILDSICIAVVCFPGCDAINSEINLVSLIKPFFYMTKKSSRFSTWQKSQDKNLNILRTKAAFKVIQKVFSIDF